VAPPQTAVDLCDMLVRSELVGLKLLDEFRARLQAAGKVPADAAAFAAVAVKDGLITYFQARLLLKGKWRNFFLGGKYKVMEHLGSGGMGNVFLCEHRHMRRRVAVKIFPPDQQDPTQLKRFMREAQAVAMVNHPNIVRAFDIDQEAGVHFLVMEYIDGVSLQRLVDARGPLSVDRAINYVAQAACGLQHAHEQGLVHRDVKPSNLMLERTGAVKVLDLGLARISTRASDGLSHIRRPDAPDVPIVLGTADYLAPEQARSSTVDGRADVYSLGAAAYFLLVGRPPFDGGDVQEKLIRHQTEVPARVDAERPDVPAGIADVIARMLSKSPNGRPQTPALVLTEFQPWLTDVPAPTPEEIPSRYSPHRDVDTQARQSTAAMVSKSSRALIMKTMSMVTGANGEVAG